MSPQDRSGPGGPSGSLLRGCLRRRRSATGIAVGAALVVAVAACAAGGASAARPPRGIPAAVGASPNARADASGPTTADSTNWTVYHGNSAGSGAGPAALDLRSLRPRWTSKRLDGQLYGEPLVWDEKVYAATENDTVYALSAASGAIMWSRHLAAPVPSGELPCGDITPEVGITSTPVIDAVRTEIFLVADEVVHGAVRHELYGLNAASGRIELSQPVDPRGASTTAILQRASLTLDGPHVVFAFGGNYGDCASYHGWVESVPVTGGRAHFFEVDARPGESQGAIWMGGAAPVVDGTGDIWVAAGNGSVTSPSGSYDHSDSVLELSSTMSLMQYFAPADWYSDNRHDLDLGSSVPAVLPNGLVVQAGKSQTAYLLRASRLGGVGGQLEQARICGNTVDGGVAFSGSVVYLPCENGVMRVSTDAATGKMKVAWQTATGAGGPPVLAGGYVWTISNGTLLALSPRTGRLVQSVAVGSSATDFPTPLVCA